MQTSRTSAIILRRINYGEADRILTLLTRDYGKIALIAKGVRKEKSKLAGGIELFSESDISFIKGKGDVGTLVSTQLNRHFGNIHTDLDRVRVASDFLSRVDSVSEDGTGQEFYDIVIAMFMALNTRNVPCALAHAWGTLRLLLTIGEVINLEADATDAPFDEASMYRFSYEDNRFYKDQKGSVSPLLIKFIRLLGYEEPAVATRVKGYQDLASQASHLLELAYSYNRPTTHTL